MARQVWVDDTKKLTELTECFIPLCQQSVTHMCSKTRISLSDLQLCAHALHASPDLT